MRHQDDRAGPDQASEIDRGVTSGATREATPIPSSSGSDEDAPIAPGLERAAGDRAAHQIRLDAISARWRERRARPTRASINLAGARAVLAALLAPGSR